MKYREFVSRFLDGVAVIMNLHQDIKIYWDGEDINYSTVPGPEGALINSKMSDLEIWNRMNDLWKRIIKWPDIGSRFLLNTDDQIWSICVGSDVLSRTEYPAGGQVVIYHLHLCETTSDMRFVCLDCLSLPRIDNH